MYSLTHGIWKNKQTNTTNQKQESKLVFPVNRGVRDGQDRWRGYYTTRYKIKKLNGCNEQCRKRCWINHLATSSLAIVSQGILKLKYKNFCLEKQGCQGMVKVGKRQKKRGNSYEANCPAAAEGSSRRHGNWRYSYLLWLSCKKSSFLSLHQMICSWNQLSTVILNYRTCRF